MRQFQYSYENDHQFRKDLSKLSQWCSTKVISGLLFTIFSENMDTAQIDMVRMAIEQEFPNADYMGCSTNGNIINGVLCNTSIGITCTVFEYTSTRFMTRQYKLTADSMKDAVEAIIADVDANPWIKAAELLTTIRGMSMTPFCDGLEKLRDGVSVFGGGAFNIDMDDNEALVFSKKGGYSHNAVVFAYFGGEELHVQSMYISGWKPLGKELHVTRAEGSILYELDGIPAYNTYYRYLHIQNNENFFRNTLEFPFFYKNNGIDILRAPVSSNPDGSLTMTSDIRQGALTRMAYGDPWTILDSVRENGKEMMAFKPETLKIFSCAARRTFWGNEEISKETEPFQSIAPTSGFYTSSEFLRTGKYLNQHNVTLVIAGMREGVPEDEHNRDFEMDKDDFSGKVSMIKRLATFIEAATEDLEKANSELSRMAVTDGLTQLLNRGEIQHQISRAVKAYRKSVDKNSILSLIMLDIDNFKQVNDRYGHNVGDDVLKGLSSVLKNKLSPENTFAGRWGGEEFMILLMMKAAEAADIAEMLRKSFSDIDFQAAGHQTVSLGVTEINSTDDPDSICIRVDQALYEAKRSGKNRVIMA